MFEYILAGFTGTFFSYFCVFLCGIELHAFAAEISSERVLRVMRDDHDDLETKMDRIIHLVKEINSKNKII